MPTSDVEAKMPTLDSSKAMMFLGLGDWWWFDGEKNHTTFWMFFKPVVF